jgi:hypothetical protein
MNEKRDDLTWAIAKGHIESTNCAMFVEIHFFSKTIRAQSAGFEKRAQV